jgi:hypothetical protein
LNTRDARRVGGVDLQVLGGVGVDDGEAVFEVVDEHGRGLLATECGQDALGVPGEMDLFVQLRLDVVGQPE